MIYAKPSDNECEEFYPKSFIPLVCVFHGCSLINNVLNGHSKTVARMPPDFSIFHGGTI